MARFTAIQPAEAARRNNTINYNSESYWIVCLCGVPFILCSVNGSRKFHFRLNSVSLLAVTRKKFPSLWTSNSTLSDDDDEIHRFLSQLCTHVHYLKDNNFRDAWNTFYSKATTTTTATAIKTLWKKTKKGFSSPKRYAVFGLSPTLQSLSNARNTKIQCNRGEGEREREKEKKNVNTPTSALHNNYTMGANTHPDFRSGIRWMNSGTPLTSKKKEQGGGDGGMERRKIYDAQHIGKEKKNDVNRLIPFIFLCHNNGPPKEQIRKFLWQRIHRTVPKWSKEKRRKKKEDEANRLFFIV